MPKEYPPTPSKDEIRARYADRTFTCLKPEKSVDVKPKPERQYLDLRPDLTKQLLCPPGVVGEDSSQFDHVQVLNEDPDHPITLTIKRGDPESLDSVELFIKVNDRVIAMLSLLTGWDQGRIIEIFHRIVDREFRGSQNSSGERLSNILLKAAEDYVRHVARRVRKPQPVGLITDQLEVILWMLENDYEIAAEDQGWWAKIQAGDPHIIMCQGHFMHVADLADIAKLRMQESGESDFSIHPRHPRPVFISFKKNILSDESTEDVIDDVRTAIAG
ncbi:MAG: hypothetical protein V1908_00910 [Candidatus Peregrinibacteria bacterium]